MTIKKLADLKRIPIGTRLVLTECLLGPCRKARVVAKVQTNAIAFTGDGIEPGRMSWLPFPKAASFQAEPNGFAIYEMDDRSGRLILGARYEFAPAEAPIVAARPLKYHPNMTPAEEAAFMAQVNDTDAAYAAADAMAPNVPGGDEDYEDEAGDLRRAGLDHRGMP